MIHRVFEFEIFHQEDSLHMLFVGNEFVKTGLINCFLSNLSQPLGRLEGAFESLHVVNLQPIDILSLAWQAVGFLAGLAAEIGRHLLHLHSVGPVALGLEKQYLQVLLVSLG